MITFTALLYNIVCECMKFKVLPFQVLIFSHHLDQRQLIQLIIVGDFINTATMECQQGFIYLY